MKKEELTRKIVEITVDKALRDIAQDPERSVRKIVDLGKTFAKGRFQQYFFSSMEEMLRHEDSAYYALAKNIVAHVDPEAIKTFGINIGYNGCNLGAEKIRALEAAHGHNIPWLISFQVSDSLLPAIGRAIPQAKELGTYTFALSCPDQNLRAVLPLLEAHPDCAFLLIVKGDALADADLAMLAAYKNHILLLDAALPRHRQLCEELRQQKMLYGLYEMYAAETWREALSAERLQQHTAVLPTFVLLLAQPGTDAATRAEVYAMVRQQRSAQQYPYILMDLLEDAMYIDQVISNDACCVMFSANGDLLQLPSWQARAECNLHTKPLAEIFASCLRKQ